MVLVTSAEMRAIDRYAIDVIGLPALVLMENAGRAVAEEVIRLQSKLQADCLHKQRSPRWLILVGKGIMAAMGL